MAYIQNNLGMAYEHNGARVEALTAYRRAQEIDAGHPSAGLHVARLEPLIPAETVDEGEALAVLDGETTAVAQAELPEPLEP